MAARRGRWKRLALFPVPMVWSIPLTFETSLWRWNVVLEPAKRSFRPRGFAMSLKPHPSSTSSNKYKLFHFKVKLNCFLCKMQNLCPCVTDINPASYFYETNCLFDVFQEIFLTYTHDSKSVYICNMILMHLSMFVNCIFVLCLKKNKSSNSVVPNLLVLKSRHPVL